MDAVRNLPSVDETEMVGRSSLMKLAALAKRLRRANLTVGDSSALAEIEISRVTSDSREVAPGDLFVAVRGLRADGHDYLDGVIEAGAAAVVVERGDLDGRVPCLRVSNGAAALGELVAELAGDPATRMSLVGLTGTNGKTTTSYLLEAIVRAANRSPGIIGTVSYRYAGTDHPAPYTTPVPDVLHQTFAAMADAGVDVAIVEVSSAALSMERVAGTRFDVAAFSNLSQDHLDIHGDMTAYGAAKARLFSERLADFSKRLNDKGCAVINIDDPAAEQMIAAATGKRILKVSAQGAVAADVRVVSSELRIDGIRAVVATPRGQLTVESEQLLGDYNIANLALAIGVSEALGIEHAAISRGIGEMRGVPGRVERVVFSPEDDRGLDIIVDYAHTPDALVNVLCSLRSLCKGRLICVFGCGGDRDPAKRLPMGRAVAENADLAFVTSDNPRTEDPLSIIDQILPGIPNPFFVDADRGIAIRAAIAEAAPGDVVLIAGKGHEDYQILGTEKIHFDDREHAAAAARARPRWSLAELAEAVGARASSGDVSGTSSDALAIDRITIDGRTATRGDLYVSIRGERVDGHDYIDQAVGRGAVAAVVEAAAMKEHSGSTVPFLEVGDGREALGAIGRLVRRQWGMPLIGVTGSAGKTTTKDLIAAALASQTPLKSRGSLNNETGVPLTLLKLRKHHRVAVVEMGMRGLGQIRYLCDFAEPTVGIVTNAGVAHIGVVGSASDIVKGKSEMFASLPDGGIAIYPADDERLAMTARAASKQLSFGEEPSADVRLVSYASRADGTSDLQITANNERVNVHLGLSGRHNAINATCAMAAAIAVGVSMTDAAAGLERALPPAMRGERELVSGRHLLIDCYNSNPAALAAALTTVSELAGLGAGRALAVIGDMLELGESAEHDHREAGKFAATLGIDVVAIGQWATQTADGAIAAGGTATVADDPVAAGDAAMKRSSGGDWILFKASRGAKLERVVDAVRESALSMSSGEDTETSSIHSENDSSNNNSSHNNSSSNKENG